MYFQNSVQYKVAHLTDFLNLLLNGVYMSTETECRKSAFFLSIYLIYVFGRCFSRAHFILCTDY